MILFAVAIDAGAQDTMLSAPMLKFAAACVNADRGVRARDAVVVQGSIDTLMNMPLTLLQAPRFTVAEGSDTVSLANHLLFTPEFLDSLLLSNFSFDAVAVNPPVVLRSDDMPDVGYANIAIAAGGKATFGYKGSGNRQLVVIPEGGTSLKVSLHDATNGIDTASQVKDGVAAIVWIMRRFSKYEFTIENPTDKAVSLVVGISL